MAACSSVFWYFGLPVRIFLYVCPERLRKRGHKGQARFWNSRLWGTVETVALKNESFWKDKPSRDTNLLQSYFTPGIKYLAKALSLRHVSTGKAYNPTQGGFRAEDRGHQMRRCFLFLALFTLIAGIAPAWAAAQTATEIRGVVTDQVARPMAGVT